MKLRHNSFSTNFNYPMRERKSLPSVVDVLIFLEEYVYYTNVLARLCALSFFITCLIIIVNPDIHNVET